MKKKKRIVPQSSKASASSVCSTPCSSITPSPSNSTHKAECSENSPQEPQPGTSTGGVTPSDPQHNTSTRGSVRCAAKGRVYYGSDTPESSSDSDLDSGDDEKRPDTSTVPQTARKTNNPAG